MLYNLELTLHIFIVTFNIFPLIYYPFRYKFNIKKEKIIIFFIPITLMTMIIFFNLYENIHFEEKNAEYLKLLSNSISVVLLYLLVKKDFYKALFVFFIQIQYSNFIFGNTYVIIRLLESKYTVVHHIHLLGSFLTMFQIIIMYPIISNFIKNKVIPTLSIDDDKILKDNCIIQVILRFFEFIISIGVDFSFNSSIKYILTRCCILSIYYYLFSTFCRTATEINYKLRLEKKSLYISNQLNSQKKHYTDLSNHIKEIRAAKHDLKHHLTLIESYLASKDTKKLEEYIKEYKLTIPANIEIYNEQNFMLNTLFHRYIQIANSNGIDLNIKFDLDNNLAIQDTDLCIVFGNCIENAIEACNNLELDNRKIYVRTKIHNDMILITIDNNFNGKIEKKGDIYLSSKRSYSCEGIGIASVKEIVKKYNGYAKFEPTEREFKVSVMMEQHSIL